MANKIELAPDAQRGNMKRVELTLSATPNTVTSVVIPTSARGFGIRPASYMVDFNVGAAPENLSAVATNDQDVVASDEYAGGFAFADEWTWRLLEDYHPASNASRMLYIKSTTASVVVRIEFF